MTVDESANIPRAKEVPRRSSWAWLITIGAVAFASWLGYEAWQARGSAITIELDDGYGLRPGDPVKHKGIAVGHVRAVEMTEDLDRILVTVVLSEHATELARSGARFWVVRPRLDVTGIAGLETVVGPRYLALLPGHGPPQRHFVGLTDPPVIERVEDGDLEIILESPTRGGIRAGAAVTYRQIKIGTVLSVGLSSDGTSVEARVHIQKAYAGLIKTTTRFWKASGIEASFGISGASVQLESLESLVAGGVALATPPGVEEMARTGQRFALADKADDEWLDWQPFVAIGSSFLPPGSPLPTPQRAVRGWDSGGWFKSSHSRRGWVLPTEAGLLGPKDMLAVSDESQSEHASLEVAGQSIPLTGQFAWNDDRLGLLAVDMTRFGARWASSRVRRPNEFEDCIIVGDPAGPPIPLAATRLTQGESVWELDPTVPVDESWHGACALSRIDGALLGLVIVSEGRAYVAHMPANWPPE